MQSNRIESTLQDILSTLKSSNIIPRLAADPTLRFWNTYQLEADEHDRELFEKYNGSMDTGLIFVSYHLFMLPEINTHVSSHSRVSSPLSTPTSRASCVPTCHQTHHRIPTIYSALSHVHWITRPARYHSCRQVLPQDPVVGPYGSSVCCMSASPAVSLQHLQL